MLDVVPAAGSAYRGGADAARAFFAVFFEIPNRRAIARIAIPSARCSRRISAQSSTPNTPDRQRWVNVQPEPEGQAEPTPATDWVTRSRST